MSMNRKWILTLFAMTVASLALAGCADTDEATEDVTIDTDPGAGSEIGQEEPGEGDPLVDEGEPGING